MKQSEAEQVYLNHKARTEALINSMGDNPQAINAFITNTYSTLYQNEPAFLWFSLGTMVSSTVGQNLQVATQAVIRTAGQAAPAKLVVDSFGKGNQAIFKDIIPLF